MATPKLDPAALMAKVEAMPEKTRSSRAKLEPYKDVLKALQAKGFSLKDIQEWIKIEMNINVSQTSVRNALR